MVSTGERVIHLGDSVGPVGQAHEPLTVVSCVVRFWYERVTVLASVSNFFLKRIGGHRKRGRKRVARPDRVAHISNQRRRIDPGDRAIAQFVTIMH